MAGMVNAVTSLYRSKPSAFAPRPAGWTTSGVVNSGNDRPKNREDISRMKRALQSGAEATIKASTPTSVLEGMQLYSQSLKKQRDKSQDTALAKRKLKYNFKSISSKIISSKTSVAARQVVGQAKREIEKLRNARRSGKYDSEEIDAAIDHAKAMERIARKKARHLEEEEMAKRCSSSSGQAAAPPDDDQGRKTDPVEEEIKKLRDEIREMGGKAENGEYIESGQVTNEMIEDICEDMEDMLEDIEELNDLMDELVSNPVDMDPEDFDAMRIKHRNKEMKEMTKADGEYLKAMFEMFERQSGAEQAASAVDVAL